MLGPLFLVSGLSTAAALNALLTKSKRARRNCSCASTSSSSLAEIGLVALFLISLATGPAQHIEALHAIMGGTYTMVFWVLFFGIGLIIPLLLEMLEIRGIAKSVAVIAPVLVLIGGYALRQVMLDVGQESTWTNYDTQFNAELFDRLHR